MENFKADDYGWINPISNPTNHNNVVVLLYLINEKLYQEVFGYFENNEWNLTNVDDSDYKILGWHPYPYSPMNN